MRRQQPIPIPVYRKFVDMQLNFWLGKDAETKVKFAGPQLIKDKRSWTLSDKGVSR